MDAIFLQLFNMSIAASWIVLAVVLLRLLLKKAPKAFTCALWVIVAIRLVCPFSFESVLSLIPSAETVPQDIVYAKEPVINSGIASINQVVNPIITETFAPPNELTSVNPIQIFLAVVANLWVLGMIGMLIYTLISYMRLRRRVREAVPFSDGVWICDNINTPFILGVLRPRIYLPSAMDKANTEYVIAHERAHLSRRDHLWKPLGFLLLTVYWFNPVMWLAYVLLCRDIELACDERVIRDMNADDKKAYSTALLECSIPRRMISACPLAFGEVGVKQRIKSVLSYKKPAFWLIVAALVVCVAVAVCFLTNPKVEDYSDLPSVSEHAYEVDEVVYGALYLSTLMFPGQNTPYFSITDDLDLLRKAEADTNEGWVDLGKLESITLSKYNFDVFFDIDNGLGWADDVSAKSIRTETAKAWKLADDELYYVLQQKDGSVYLAYGNSSKIHHVFKLETNIREDTGLIAISGANTVPIKVLTTEHSLEEIKNEVYWLDITFGENQFTPFDIYGDGNRQLGLFNIYDANTFEPLDFFTPSGLDPHTYIFQNATDGGEYIITMRWEYGIEEGSTALLCFGARLPGVPITGTWEAPVTIMGLPSEEIPDNPMTTYVFRDDGTGVCSTPPAEDTHFTYTATNGILTLTYDEKSALGEDDFVQFYYECDGETLKLTHTERKQTITFSKVKAYTNALLSSGPDIVVFPSVDRGGYYSEFILKVGDKEKSFTGMCLSDDHWKKSMYIEDLTGDGQAEIAVVFQSNSGTGFYAEDIHVFDSRTLEEYEVEKLYETIGEHIDFSADEEAFYITIANKTHRIDKDVLYPHYEKEYLWELPNTDEIFRYSVSNGILHVTMECKLAPFGVCGEIIADYKFENNKFVYDSAIYIGEESSNTEIEVQPVEGQPTKLAMTFFAGNNLPENPQEVSSVTFDYEQNGDLSVLRGENKEYLDNAHLSSLETDEPVFSFSLYQDALEYTEALLAILNSVVTVDYEGNTFDTTDAIKEHIYVSMNGVPAVVTEVRLGKGNGHLDFYFKFKTESKIEFKDIKTFNFVVK